MAILGILAITEFPAWATPIPGLRNSPSIAEPNSIQRDLAPDYYFYMAAWEKFGEINRKSDCQNSIAGKITNNAVWEIWADDALTFPDDPDPQNPPQWTSTESLPKKLELRSKVERVRLDRQFSSSLRTTITVGGTEEIRRDKRAFDYIINNHLWYTQGLEAAFNKEMAISFPFGSIEVKANWTPIKPEQKSDYHWNYDRNGNLYGLVALHIMHKGLSNWLWATWEWKGNKGRCDYIGCHDSYGMNPPDVQPNPNIGQMYPAGELTPEVIKLLEEKGLEGEWLQEWKNYRLKGTQNGHFSDSVGQPTLLGNSIIEEGFVPSSSCITCHARAAINSKGMNAFPRAGFKPPIPGEPFPNLQSSYNGSPDPDWYYHFTSISDPSKPSKILENLQMDFVWSIPVKAKPCNKGDCTAKPASL
ncbi:MAG: hypothetical protein LDL41_12290 [Coleofasciculus sp. S288]|nr:hypothetical protein [Coleofasciculus sp. S288]